MSKPTELGEFLAAIDLERTQLALISRERFDSLMYQATVGRGIEYELRTIDVPSGGHAGDAWRGIRQGVADGTRAIVSRMCYGEKIVLEKDYAGQGPVYVTVLRLDGNPYGNKFVL